MRTLFGTLLVLLLCSPLPAQVTEGTIVFESKVNLHKNLPEEMMQMKNEIPEFRTSMYALYFDLGESYYAKDDAATPEEDRFAGRRGNRRFARNREQLRLYTDLKTGISLESREFFGKQFLISGTPNDYQWKFTGESKQVGSYFCQQAVYQDSLTDIEVWFTPVIPVPSGPENFLGLPGMVLYVNIDDGSRVITAVEIRPGDLPENAILRPTQGEPITRTDYRKLVREKRKEMQQESGGRNRIWRIRND